MQTSLKNEIKRLAKRQLSRELAKESKANEYRIRYHKRTGLVAGVAAATLNPPIHKHFDPKYCARNANLLAKTIWYKILSNSYEPLPAVSFEVPKPAGGTRTIMSFSIPDAAVANIFLERVRSRNLKRLSPHSFAYHPQKNVFDAILSLSNFISDEKLFAVQIDFEKYFDNIPTSYLRKCLDNKNLISITPHERAVFDRFLRHRYANKHDYTRNKFTRRIKGTPQGCSISLLLANLASHELDTSLERCAGKFVRFADDVTAFCNKYSDAEDIERRFVEHCTRSGIIINEKKSPGLAVISRSEAEMRHYEFIDYLGYRFSKDGLDIPDRVVKRIKTKISGLIQIYLLQYQTKFGFNHTRVGTNPNYDWDLLGLISEIRKYLYGGLSEKDISAFINSGTRLPQMRGLMGFYALIERKEQLQALDGWLLDVMAMAGKKRHRILKQQYGASSPVATKLSLINGDWLNLAAWRGAEYPETGLPSFTRGWRAARKHYFTFGLEEVEPPNYIAYY